MGGTGVKFFRRLSLLLTITLLLSLVCGCSGTRRTAIQNYLEEKYGDRFQVLNVFREFNGLDGGYLRAICENKETRDTFEVYCYPAHTKSGAPITIAGKEYVISDDYADVLFQNKLKAEIRDRIGSEVFLQCQVTFADHFITEEEYRSGMRECLENTKLYSHVTVYVVVQDESQLEDIRQKVESVCLGYNAYYQYLYFAVAPEGNHSTLQTHFDENEASYDRHLNKCDQIEKVIFSLIKRDEGITKRSVEKG